MSDRFATWRDRLAATAVAGRTRHTTVVTPTGATTARVDGREVIVACSNDYLGLAHHPDVLAAARGGGAGASRLLGGTRPEHAAVEAALADHFGQTALFFPSGWHANLAVMATVAQPGDLVASDALVHASIIDGLRLSKARRAVLPHARPDVPEDARMIVVESLYSMDGDIPSLAAYPKTPWLVVDEAHAVGALGPGGRGVAAAQGVRPDVTIGTFGKAYGSAGAFVLGPPELRDLLVNEGRSFLFSTAPPEPVARMALAGLRAADDEKRQQLASNTSRLRAALGALGWSPLGEAHIVPIVVGPDVMAVAARLLAAGVLAPGVRWPTVPTGQERIRLTVSAAHTPEQLDRIAEALGVPPG